MAETTVNEIIQKQADLCVLLDRIPDVNIALSRVDGAFDCRYHLRGRTRASQPYERSGPLTDEAMKTALEMSRDAYQSRIEDLTLWFESRGISVASAMEQSQIANKKSEIPHG